MCQLVERISLEHGNARLAWCRRGVCRPVDLDLVRACIHVRKHARAGALALVARAHFLVLGVDLRNEVRPEVGAQEIRGHAHAARGVLHPHHGVRIVRRDFYRCVHARGRGAADQQRNREAFALHFLRDMRHFIERRRDQAGQADDIHLFLFRGFEDFRRRHHDAEVDDLVVVAGQHHAHDVLADVVHVALDRRHENLALGAAASGLLRLDEGDEPGHGLFHDARALDHLRQEHLAGAEQVTDDVHAVHERAFDDLDGARELLARLFGVPFDEPVDAVHQRVCQPLGHRCLAPGEVLGLGFAAFAGVFRGHLEQPLGRIRPAIENDVLDALAQFRRDVRIHRQLAGVHNAHGHAGLDRVVQEHRVDRLAHRVVAAERK